MAEKTSQERFFESIREVYATIEVFKTYFESIEELQASLALALENETHASLLMQLVTKRQKR